MQAVRDFWGEMSKVPYREGDVFAVTLDGGGFFLGVVARMPKSGKVLLGYFFRLLLVNMPMEIDVPMLCPENAAKIAKFSDLFIMRGKWPVISHIQGWNREHWPMPRFVRRDPISGRSFLTTYSEDNPVQPVSEERCDFDIALETDSVWGAGFAEVVLAKTLK